MKLRKYGKRGNELHLIKKHVNKFIFYLKEQGLSDRPKDIDLDVVDSCIGYYCQVKGELNTRSTMQAHLEALKSFYDYLVDKRKEEDIFPIIIIKSIKAILLKNMDWRSRLSVEHFPIKKLYRY